MADKRMEQMTNMNLNFNVSEPVEKKNITTFFLSSIEKNNNKLIKRSDEINKLINIYFQ